MLYTLIATFVACFTFYYYLTRTFGYWRSRNVTGPKPVPLFGNLRESALRKKNLAIIFKEAYDQYPDEKIVGMYRMTTPCILLRDLDLIKHIFIKDFNIFSDRGVASAEKGLGNNLFHAATDKWRVLRNRFTPLFTSGKLKNMIYLMEQRGDKFVSYLEGQNENSTEFDFHALYQKYTMATIAACAFGLDLDKMGDKVTFLEKMDTMLTTPSFVDEWDMMFPGALRKLNVDMFPKNVTEFFNQLVSAVISQRNGVPSGRKDFMDLILELRQEAKEGLIHGIKRSEEETQVTIDLTDDIIAAQAFAFYAAGYETSASTMAFLTYEMAKHQDIQEKVIAEVDEVLKKFNGEVTYETLNELKYMQKVLDETLRLYPIVEPIQRMAQADYQFPGTDVTIKKGQMVIISTMGIQRDAKYYPDPEKFDPERFSFENSQDRHPCAYIPFGIGPRNCLGMRFSKYQSRMCLLKFFSKFRVEPCSRTLPEMRFAPKRFIVGAEKVYLKLVQRKC